MEKRRLGITLAVTLVAFTANASDSNEKLKECLNANGYSVEKFDEFAFSKAAACHQTYIIKMSDAKLAELRKFIKENPWYKGQYWDWEKCASNSSCIQNYQFLIR